MEGARSILGHMTQEPSRHARAVHRLMEERGLSRNAFAKLAGVSEGALRALDVRNGLLSGRTIATICKHLGMTEDEFLEKGDLSNLCESSKVTLVHQIGENTVDNSQLILRSIRNLEKELVEFAGQMAHKISDLAASVEKAKNIEAGEDSDESSSSFTARRISGRIHKKR